MNIYNLFVHAVLPPHFINRKKYIILGSCYEYKTKHRLSNKLNVNLKTRRFVLKVMKVVLNFCIQVLCY